MNKRNHSLRSRINRPMILSVLTVMLALVLIARLFVLQVVRGDAYNEQFITRTTKRIAIPAKRGRILDRNGNVIADTRTVQNVAIVDVTGNSSSENDRLNTIIQKAVSIVKDHGETISLDFGIAFDGQGYVFTQSGASQLRFLADVYGYPDPQTMTEEERNSSAEKVVSMLAQRYKVAEDDTTSAGRALILDTVKVRYALSLNAFAKYNETILARDVTDGTVQAILEAEDLDGVSISASYRREYSDSVYLSAVTGYTSQITPEELGEKGEGYCADDYIGTVGIEASMEEILHGTDGYREISVDNLGREQAEVGYQMPEDGGDVTLTIDADLQKAAYQIIEKNLSLILLGKITDDISTFEVTQDMTSDDIRIPANDVYGSLLAYTIDRDHLGSENASDAEREVKESFDEYLRGVKDTLREDLQLQGEEAVGFADQSTEYRTYYSYIVQALYDRGILDRERIDTDDDVYTDWTDGYASAGEFLRRAVSQGWVDMDSVRSTEGVDAGEDDFAALTDYIMVEPCEDYSFGTAVCRYLLRSGSVTGPQICRVLFDQEIYTPSESVRRDIESGSSYAAYRYVRDQIANLSITPAQLYLYPYSGSAVITDADSGEVLALVSYPGYDAGRLSESSYMDKIIMDPTKPMLNTATQQRTAPGSTFKMAAAAAGLREGVISTDEYLYCSGTFDRIDPSPRCWIYPGGHGALDLAGGIANSCNLYFYQVGYRLGLDQNTAEGTEDAEEDYDSDLGVERLAEHASALGLSELSGVEIEEADPVIATRDSVRAAIGQSNNGFTTTQLARYVTDVANSGYDRPLTLIASQEKEGTRRLALTDQEWDAIHDGMRRVVRGRTYLSTMYRKNEDGKREYFETAGKTGTAQQGGGRPNHALFVGYAPLDTPEITIAARIPNGYKSDYTARMAGQIMQYYFDRQCLYDLLHDERIPGGGDGD